jgi:hypothetical protein
MESAQIWSIFSTDQVLFKFGLEKWLGQQHYGRLFYKLIWSPCRQRPKNWLLKAFIRLFAGLLNEVIETLVKCLA